MSKPKYRWWGYVRWMIRDYPKYKQLLCEIKQPSITPKISGLPNGKGKTTDTTANLALASLPPKMQKEFDAVQTAISQTKNQKVLTMIRLVYWDGTHTVVGAGYSVGYEEAQAKRLHGEFIRQVAKNYGLL